MTILPQNTPILNAQTVVLSSVNKTLEYFMSGFNCLIDPETSFSDKSNQSVVQGLIFGTRRCLLNMTDLFGHIALFYVSELRYNASFITTGNTLLDLI